LQHKRKERYGDSSINNAGGMPMMFLYRLGWQNDKMKKYKKSTRILTFLYLFLGGYIDNQLPNSKMEQNKKKLELVRLG
jgi:hypothetical protein